MSPKTSINVDQLKSGIGSLSAQNNAFITVCAFTLHFAQHLKCDQI